MENPNSDFSIKRKLPPHSGVSILEELTRAQEFFLKEDNKHFKHVSSIHRDQIHIMIEIKPRGPLSRSKLFKTIQGD